MRLRVRACALNHLDLLVRLGFTRGNPSFPKRTVSDVAGVVSYYSTIAGPSMTSAGEASYGGPAA